MRETDDIERLFQESFEGFEVIPPASVKAAIDKGIKRKTGLIWWLSALFLVLIAAAGYFALNARSNQKNSSAEIASAQHSDSPNQNGSKQNTSSNPITHPPLSHSQSNIPSKNNFNSKSPSDKLFGQNKNTNNSTNPDNKSKKTSTSKKTEATSKAKLSKTQKNSSKGEQTKTNSKIKAQPANNLKQFPINKQIKGTNQKQKLLPDKKPVSAPGPEVVDNSNPKSPGKQPEQKEMNLTSLDPDKKPYPNLDSARTLTNESPQTVDKPQNDSKDDSNKDENNWTLSFYAGPQFDIWRTRTQDEELAMKPSFRTSLEINRNLPFNFSVSTGAGYNKFEEKYSISYIQSIDSVYVGTDTIPIFDQQNPDSIIGYNYIDNYTADTTKGTRSNTFNTTAISIPLHLRRTFELSDKWVVMTDLGASFNFYKTTKSNSSDSIPLESGINSFGINASMRLHAGYKLNNWMFTIGVNGSLYLKTPVIYDGLANKRYYFSPQLGIHYTF
jgi:hypothetical protein